MRVLTRALATLGLAALAGATSLSAQDLGVGAYRLYVGASGGVMNFGTINQSRGGIPMIGANALITGKRAGLLVGIDAGLGSNEIAGMADPTDGSSRIVVFDRIFRYQFMLMAYPLRSHIQPFVGVGGGIQTLQNPLVQGVFLDDGVRQANQAAADDLGSTGFAQLVAGVEVRAGILNVFGSVSAATGGNDLDLIQGRVYTVQGGARISLGKSREDLE
jgi:hypothetical protein